MINAAKFSVDESSLRYQARTKLAELANEIASARNPSKVEDKILLATKIRLWLKALDYKNYLTREQREKIWYALIDLSGIYDFPVAPVLSNMPRPNILIGTGGGSGSVNEWGDIGGTLSNQLDLQAALDAKVDLSGDTMTGDLGFTGAGINPTDYVQFNTAYTGGILEGRLKWNPTDGRLEVGLPGSNILGDTSPGFVRVVNKTGTTIARGKAVYINGGQGNRPTITLASNASEATSTKTFGITLESINNNNNGYVLKFGFLYDVNTAAFSAGQTIYLGTNGDWTGTKPVAPNHMVALGKVINVSATVGTVYVDVQNGFEVEELHNVLITSLQNGDVLTYDSATSLWKNAQVSGGHIIQDNGSSLTQRAKLNFQRMVLSDDSVNGASVVKRPADTVISTTAPASPLEGDVWTDSSTMKTYKYYDSYWVETTPVVTGTVTSISTTAPITGGPITTTGTIGITQATTSTDGYLSSTDWNTFNNKQNTITNPVTGTGTSGQVTYWSGTNTVTGSSTFVFTPTSQFLVNNAVTASGAIARGINFTPSLTAAANNDVLVGLDINPTFTNGAFTGVSNYGLRSQVTSGTDKWNLYISGTASNYLAGSLGIGTSIPFSNGIGGGLELVGTLTRYGVMVNRVQGTNRSAWLVHNGSGGGEVYLFNNGNTNTIYLNGNGFSYFGPNVSLGIGSVTDGGQKLQVTGTSSFTGTTATDGGQLGSELLSSSGWTSTGWTGDFATGWTHSTGNTTALTNTLAAVNGTYYQITYTVTGRTAGTFTIAFGGYTSGSLSATGAVGPRATSTGTLSITPTTDFDGKIVISIKAITAGTASIVLKNSAGTITNEIRSDFYNANLFIGVAAGGRNTTGGSNNVGNLGIGINSLSANTSGTGNLGIGNSTLQNLTIGGSNIAIGYQSLLTSTTSFSNTAIGYQTLYFTNGSFNTAIGTQALFNTTSGSNTAVGDSALFNISSTSNNTAIGKDAGRYAGASTTANQTSSNSIYVGYQSRSSASGNTNEVVIGYNVVGSGSNTVTIGNSSTTDNYLYGNFNVTDAKNIILGTTTGTKIGTSTSQKIGFFNATPVVQPISVTTSQGIADALTSLGLLASSSVTQDNGSKLFLYYNFY